jgi:uncharacterized protein
MQMNKWAIAITSSIGLLLISPVMAASFDCSKASNPYEKAVCANPNLSSLDDQLAVVYKNARAKSPDPEALRKTQIDWIKATRQCASDTSCIEKAYKDRIVALGGGAQPQAAAMAQAPSQQAQKTTTPSPTVSVNPNISQAQQVDLGMISGISVRLISPVNVGGKVYYVLNTTNTNITDESNRKTLNNLFNKGKDTSDSERVLKFEKNTIVLLNTQEISRLREALGYKLPPQWKIGNVASATKVGPNTHHNVALTSKDIFTNGGGVYGGVAIVQLNPTEPINLADSTPKLDQRTEWIINRWSVRNIGYCSGVWFNLSAYSQDAANKLAQLADARKELIKRGHENELKTEMKVAEIHLKKAPQIAKELLDDCNMTFGPVFGGKVY